MNSSTTVTTVIQNTTYRLASAFDADQRLSGGALVEAHAAGYLEVLDDHADDLTEAQRDDGQVVAVQSQGRNADQDAEHAGHHAADQRGDQEACGGVDGDAGGDHVFGGQCGHVGADGLETAASQRQLAKHTDGEVQGRGHDDGDACGHHDALDVGVGQAGFAQRHHDAERGEDADEAHQIGLFGGKHCLLHLIRPSPLRSCP